MAHTIPGQVSGRVISPRNVLLSDVGVRRVSGVLDATYCYDGSYTGYEKVIRAGTIMALLSTGLWVPCKRTLINDSNGTDTTWVVDNAASLQVGDVVTIGGDTALTISAINYSTNTITIASTTVADNDAVYATTPAGSDVARGILNEEIDLWDEVSRTYIDRPTSQIIIAGLVDPNQILNSVAAIRAASGMYLGNIQWGDDHGVV